ncbi:hypothetical protein SNK04_010770 [Fusarium graminearum]|nr:unnamed protein product [Fusarium graminearum]
MFKDASANLLNENNPPVEPHNPPNESNTSVKFQRFEFMRRTENSVNISCILTGAVHGTMSADTKYKATLLILQFRFLPERKDRRVCEAKIELRFDAARPGNKLPEVECMSFEGIHSLFPTTQTETKTIGVDSGIGVNCRANIDTSIKMERTVRCDTSSSTIIEGEKLVVDNTLPNRVAKWTIRENKTLKIGVPTLIQVAVRIR